MAQLIMVDSTSNNRKFRIDPSEEKMAVALRHRHSVAPSASDGDDDRNGKAGSSKRRHRSIQLSFRRIFASILPFINQRRYFRLLAFVALVSACPAIKRLLELAVANPSGRRLVTSSSSSITAQSSYVTFPLPSNASALPASVESSLQHLPRLKIAADPDFSGLLLHTLRTRTEDSFRRRIGKDDEDDYHYERKSFLKSIDDRSETFLIFDDWDSPEDCEQPGWVREKRYPVCNAFHEMDFTEFGSNKPQVNTTYLNGGWYRDAWLIEPSAAIKDSFPFVFKALNPYHPFDLENLEMIFTEALTMERLTSSPYIVDTYGFCGASLFVEEGWDISNKINPWKSLGHGKLPQSKLDRIQRSGVRPLNKYTVEEKLDMAIDMAEGVAALHGFEGGVIVNNDIFPAQFVVSARDGRLKLGDHNYDMVMPWNRRKGRYCKYYSDLAARYHSPEEFRGGYIDEKADVYEVGNLIFELLTGLYTYYWETDKHNIMEMAKAGNTTPIDPRYKTRSFIERRLVEIIEPCWELDPDKRIDIFQVVKHLRETRRIHQKRKEKNAKQ